jgi:uncharacterized protein
MNKIQKTLLLILLYQGPVLLLFFRIIDYEYRYFLLFSFTILIFIYTFLRKYSLQYSLHDLGFNTKNLKTDIFLNSMFCLVIAGILLLAQKLDLIREPTIPDWKLFFIFYVFISSPLQEFLFRSLVFHELKLLGFNNTGQVLISTLNFSLMHIIYHDWLTYFSALFAGLCLGLIYNRTRSIYGVSFSHAVIGAISIYVGLV